MTCNQDSTASLQELDYYKRDGGGAVSVEVHIPQPQLGQSNQSLEERSSAEELNMDCSRSRWATADSMARALVSGSQHALDATLGGSLATSAAGSKNYSYFSTLVLPNNSLGASLTSSQHIKSSKLKAAFHELAEEAGTGASSSLFLSPNNLGSALRLAGLNFYPVHIERWLCAKGMEGQEERRSQALSWADFKMAAAEMQRPDRPASGYEILRRKGQGAATVDFDKATRQPPILLPDSLEPKLVIDEVKRAAREERRDPSVCPAGPQRSPWFINPVHARLHALALQSRLVHETLGHNFSDDCSPAHKVVLERTRRSRQRNIRDMESQVERNVCQKFASLSAERRKEKARAAKSTDECRAKVQAQRREASDRTQWQRAWKNATTAAKTAFALEQRHILAEAEKQKRFAVEQRPSHAYLQKGAKEHQPLTASLLHGIVRDNPRVAPLGLERRKLNHERARAPSPAPTKPSAASMPALPCRSAAVRFLQ
jgi:hypothetical protein